MAAAVVHKTEEMIVRLNDSASVLDAEMTAIRLALEDASGTRRLTRLQREAYDLIGYTLQLMQAHSETKQG